MLYCMIMFILSSSWLPSSPVKTKTKKWHPNTPRHIQSASASGCGGDGMTCLFNLIHSGRVPLLPCQQYRTQSSSSVGCWFDPVQVLKCLARGWTAHGILHGWNLPQTVPLRPCYFHSLYSAPDTWPCRTSMCFALGCSNIDLYALIVFTLRYRRRHSH